MYTCTLNFDWRAEKGEQGKGAKTITELLIRKKEQIIPELNRKIQEITQDPQKEIFLIKVREKDSLQEENYEIKADQENHCLVLYVWKNCKEKYSKVER